MDGRRVRLWLLHPVGGKWRDAETHPPILLLHGLGCSVEVWKPTLDVLARGDLNRPVYAVDMPGYGRSQAYKNALGMEEIADWAIRLMDVLGIPSAHIGGNSLGCQVALAMARRHPSRVRSLVLGGPTEGNDLIPLWRMAVGLLRDFMAEPWLYNSVLLKTYFQMGTVRYLQTVREMKIDDPLRRACEVSVPCLIVRGTRDGIVPERGARALSAALPRSAFVAIEGASHAVQFNAPVLFSCLALDFWKQFDSPAAEGVNSDTGK